MKRRTPSCSAEVTSYSSSDVVTPSVRVRTSTPMRSPPRPDRSRPRTERRRPAGCARSSPPLGARCRGCRKRRRELGRSGHAQPEEPAVPVRPGQAGVQGRHGRDVTVCHPPHAGDLAVGEEYRAAVFPDAVVQAPPFSPRWWHRATSRSADRQFQTDRIFDRKATGYTRHTKYCRRVARQSKITVIAAFAPDPGGVAISV